jgi:hypothetical protein
METFQAVLRACGVCPESCRRKKYGPYYQWTFKEIGKTVTVNLSVAQKNAFQEAIANNRVAEESLSKMRILSREIVEYSTSGVRRRSRAK